MDKMSSIHTAEYNWAQRGEKVQQTLLTDESPMLKRKPDTKGHILYDPMIARLFESLEID